MAFCLGLGQSSASTTDKGTSSSPRDVQIFNATKGTEGSYCMTQLLITGLKVILKGFHIPYFSFKGLKDLPCITSKSHFKYSSVVSDVSVPRPLRVILGGRPDLLGRAWTGIRISLWPSRTRGARTYACVNLHYFLLLIGLLFGHY